MPPFASPPVRQLFSVPYDFVLYITENPASPEGLEKLQQTCKYFFTKNSILIVPHLDCRQNNYAIENGPKCLPKVIAKYWSTACFIFSGPINLQKLYRISPRFLAIENAELSWKEFELITAENTVIEFHSYDTAIEGATIDVILQQLKNVTKFAYDNPDENYSVETLQKLYLLQKNRKLDDFCYLKISTVFYTLSSFSYVFLKQNFGDSEFEFHFYIYDASKTDFAEEIQRKNPNIFKVDVLEKFVSVKFL